jgi:single-stranded DNA-binding protein
MVLRISDLTMQGGGEQQSAPAQQQQQQQRPAQQPQQQPYNQPRTGYNTNGSAAPNNYNPAPQQNFQQQQPPIDFDEDTIPF